MSLQPHDAYPIPPETARVAKAAFPKGTLCLRLYDAFGIIFQDAAFPGLFAHRGRPAEAPARLAVVTLLQFAEDLSDRAAAAAVRSRIGWKYLLGLELDDPGFDYSVLSEFRAHLLHHGADRQLFETILSNFQAHGLVKSHGRQRTDSAHILAAIRAMNRLEAVVETLRHPLNVLATVVPDWICALAPAAWVDRYALRSDAFHFPRQAKARQAFAEQVGADGHVLLAAVYAPTAPTWLRDLPAVETLRQVWVQNFLLREDRICWRDTDNIPPATRFISSPYDSEARYGKKRSTSWVGYKGHLTETCDEDLPHLITDVHTGTAPGADHDALPQIHHRLMMTERLPQTHLVDTGYIEAKLLFASQQDYGVDLVGPARADSHWQAQTRQGFEASAFQIDWRQRQAICPEGHTNASWTSAVDRGDNLVIKVKFAGTDCSRCPQHARCTTASRVRRTLTLRPQAHYQALRAARERQRTEEFKALYHTRAGIEGTMSQGVRAFGLRRSRYIGLAKTHLQHLLTATAINVVRVGAWLAGIAPTQTRRCAFATAMTAAKL